MVPGCPAGSFSTCWGGCQKSEIKLIRSASSDMRWYVKGAGASATAAYQAGRRSSFIFKNLGRQLWKKGN